MRWDLIFMKKARGSSRRTLRRKSPARCRRLPCASGVFVNPAEELVRRAIGECGLNLLQFHGDEPPEFCTQFGLMSMKAFRIRDAGSLKELPKYQTDAWLLDAYASDTFGGTGEKFNWNLATEVQKLGKPVFLAGRFDAGKCRRSRPAGATIRRGCFQRCGIFAGQERSRQGARLH